MHPSTQFYGILKTLRAVAREELIVASIDLSAPADATDYTSPRTVTLVVYIERSGGDSPGDLLNELEEKLRAAHPEIVGLEREEEPLDPQTSFDGAKYTLTLTLKQ